MKFDSDTTLSRRCAIVKYLKNNGWIKYKNLIDEFNVSRPTIADDLYFIEHTFNVPLEHSLGRYGGVCIRQGWKDGTLTKEEEELLLKVFPSLESEEERNTMQMLLLRLGSMSMMSDIHKIIDDNNRN